jgi:hypothetical protein
MTISKALIHIPYRLTRIAAVFIITLSLSGCLYTKIRVPLDDDVWETKLGSRVGVASTHSVLWLFAWGDAGTKDAAKNGDITVVHHMDLGITSYLAGLYTRRDTIVYGD